MADASNEMSVMAAIFLEVDTSESQLENTRKVLVLELTRLRGHLYANAKGVHNAKNAFPIPGRIPAEDGRAR